MVCVWLSSYKVYKVYDFIVEIKKKLNFMSIDKIFCIDLYH